MGNWRAFVAVGLVLCVYHVSLIQSMAAAPAGAAVIQQRISDFGAGARLDVRLANGHTSRGLLQDIGDQDFLLANGQPGGRIRYDEVQRVKLAQRAYRAKGEPDPIEARRMVVSLGVGRHAVVKFAGRELHGHILGIAADNFSLLPDGATAPVQIAFRDVRYVEKNLSLGATIVLVVLIVAGVVIGAAVAARK